MDRQLLRFLPHLVHLLLFLSFFFFLPHHAGFGILVPQRGVKPRPSAVKAESLNHWTIREVPLLKYFKANSSHHVILPYVIQKVSLKIQQLRNHDAIITPNKFNNHFFLFHIIPFHKKIFQLSPKSCFYIWLVQNRIQIRSIHYLSSLCLKSLLTENFPSLLFPPQAFTCCRNQVGHL